MQHDYKNPNHLQSVAAIPQIIENAIYIDAVQNEDVEKNLNIESYDCYLAGINIGIWQELKLKKAAYDLTPKVGLI